jgi:predicted small secreted protein
MKLTLKIALIASVLFTAACSTTAGLAKDTYRTTGWIYNAVTDDE